MSIRPTVLLALLTFAPACASTPAGPGSADNADQDKTVTAVAGKHRSEANRVRDKFRHPVETLQFFGIRENMTVVEISPGAGGWYTEILAPYLRESGTFYAASPATDSAREYSRKTSATYLAKLKANPELYDKVNVTVFEPPQHTDIAPAGSADMVLTFRNVHNWLGSKSGAIAFKAFHRALKPGGTLGVVEHRASESAPADPTAPTGYVPESMVIRLAEEAGFKLVGKSEINANPKDTRDHPKGVWTLPPSYRLGDVEKAKYEAIGESDRMTLKFVKP